MIFTIMDSVLKSHITRTLHQLQDVYAFLALLKTFVNIWLAISLRFNNCFAPTRHAFNKVMQVFIRHGVLSMFQNVKKLIFVLWIAILS